MKQCNHTICFISDECDPWKEPGRVIAQPTPPLHQRDHLWASTHLFVTLQPRVHTPHEETHQLFVYVCMCA